MTENRFRLYGLLSLMTFLWSINYVIAKIALRSFPPLLFGPMRTMIAAIVLIPIFLVAASRMPKHAAHLDRSEIPAILFLGICGIAANQLFFILGMQQTSVAHASLVIAMTPVLVLLLAWFRDQERLTSRKLAGMAISASGVAVLNLAPGRAAPGATLFGDLLVFLAALTFAIFTVGGKEATKLHGSITVNTYGFLAGAAAGLPLALWQGWNFPWSQVSWQGWTCLFYMAAVPSVVCYLIYYWALSKVPASRVASFSYSQPLIASITGVAVLAEPITSSILAGGALVLTGVYLVGRG